MKKLFLTGIAALFLATGAALIASITPAGLPSWQTCGRYDQSCERDEWKCLASGREVWKLFCARYWTELWADDDEEPDEQEPAKPGQYYDCTDVDNSKDCVLKGPDK